MSPDLIAFLKVWHDWATSGAPHGEPFSRRAGLCGNTLRFKAASSNLWEEMEGLFGGVEYPFGVSAFFDHRNANTQHECPKRLAWVRERLVEAGEIVETLK